MAAVLDVLSIVVPPNPTAPCPVDVDVLLTNSGTAPAPFPITVCMLVATSPTDDRGSRFVGEVAGTEGAPALGAGQSVTGRVRVSLPCAPTAWLRAVAPCQAQPGVAAGLSATQTVAPVTPAPVLRVTAGVAMQDSVGNQTPDPAAVCPGAMLLISATVENVGCAGAGPSTVDMQATAGGQPVGKGTRPVGTIPAGHRAVVTFPLLKLPVFMPPTPPAIDLVVTSSGVAGQCSTSGLTATLRKPISAAATTALVPNFAVVSIRPGQDAVADWSLQNDCTDVGSVTATIRHGGDLLFSSPKPIAVPPLGSASDKVVISRPAAKAAADALYQIGAQQLDLTLAGNGQAPGPYKASATMNVTAEPVASFLAVTGFTPRNSTSSTSSATPTARSSPLP